MRTILIELLLVLMIFYIGRGVYVGLKTGTVTVQAEDGRHGHVIRKKKQPFTYWFGIIGLCLICLAFLYFLFRVHFEGFDR